MVFVPFRFVSRLFFYKVVVKVYSFYKRIMHRLGWQKIDSNIFSFIFGQKFIHVLVVSITILLVLVNLTPATRAGGLTDKAHKTILSDLIKGEFSDFEEDEQLIIETFDKENVISSVQQSYLDNLSAFRPQQRASLEDYEDEEELQTTPDGAGLLRQDKVATKKTKRARTETINYVVKSGDSISTIAENFEVSVATILWENNLSSYSIIRPGQKLVVLPQSGLSHLVKSGDTVGSIAKKYDIEETEILGYNKISRSDTLQIGDKLFIPGGKKVSLPAYKPKSYTGFTAIKNIVKAPSAKPAASNKMNWPTVGTRITQYYSWRHHGLDIANKTGTPIYAADSGTVEVLGWGTGYGNQVVINHGGGKKTRYAHLSKFFVKKGDKVEKGQTIAAMGSTGWSTGPHIHFEVIINGKKYNPLNYIK